MSVPRCNCHSCARGFRTLLPGRPVQGRPVRRLVLHGCPDHQIYCRPSCPAGRRSARTCGSTRPRRPPAGRLSGLQALPPGHLPGLPRVERAGRPGRPGHAADRRRRRRPGGRDRPGRPRSATPPVSSSGCSQAEVGAEPARPGPCPAGPDRAPPHRDDRPAHRARSPSRRVSPRSGSSTTPFARCSHLSPGAAPAREGRSAAARRPRGRVSLRLPFRTPFADDELFGHLAAARCPASRNCATGHTAARCACPQAPESSSSHRHPITCGARSSGRPPRPHHRDRPLPPPARPRRRSRSGRSTHSARTPT